MYLFGFGFLKAGVLQLDFEMSRTEFILDPFSSTTKLQPSKYTYCNNKYTIALNDKG